jgi:hypothetical protein
MSALRLVWYYLWIAPHAFQVVILFLMMRCRSYRQFPMFLLYTAAEVVQFVVLFRVSRSSLQFGSEYFRFYAAGLALSTAVRFAVIYELFVHFFQRYPSLNRPGTVVLRISIITLLLVSLGLAVSAPGYRSEFLLHSTYALSRAASILQTGLLVSLFLFSRYFALSWRSQAFGIALGFGILATLELTISALALYGLVSSTILDFARMGTYHGCVLIWLFYLATGDKNDRERRRGAGVLPSHDLEVWNRELGNLLQQ